MLVLVSAFLLLVGAPAGLLVLGRTIARVTDFKARGAVVAAKHEAGEAWYYKRMRPAFKWVDDTGD